MAALTAFKFADPMGADKAVGTLVALHEQGLIMVDDYATVSWPMGAKKPKTQQATDMKGPAALGGAFWGLLFGLLFFMPFLGAAIGAAVGALTGALIDVGIDDDFIKRVRGEVTEGTSALFLLSDNAVVDKVAAAFKEEPRPVLIGSNLSAEQEAALRAAFGETEA
jgi:uncharacterized membrane protein